MATVRQWEFAGRHGAVAAYSWTRPEPRYLAVLVHGYGEHLGRYGHVVRALLGHGAAVCGVDHTGHGESAGERVLIEDFEDVVADVHTLVADARADHPALPVVMIGHSMGGMIAARYAQLHGRDLAALVLSGPVLGRWAALEALLGLEEIPDVPIDPATLSRDPAVGEAYAADPLVWHGPFKPPTVRAFDRCIAAVNEHGSLGGLPTLWVHGEDDRLVPLEGTRGGIEAIRGADLTERVYPGARHEVFNETNAAEVLADVTAFVDRVLGAPAR
ncbi:Lysophospholipase, alpha-beta hydrolase superfamily [Thermomonospora echinospora]|uniref:Lysophospholipase, alpha-beta hydrolase superfamily n=1 Tax=Thermomonospora echinospora TaxID=1992 RepID=A0A1H6BZ13_9ACTN|nr:alpha/beta hydrolase [Thermomonospora echinospora]SEG65940.1 Lysophospholipase, alpha-beta hydrolase superfamily [Thermomonospora echinospora]